MMTFPRIYKLVSWVVILSMICVSAQPPVAAVHSQNMSRQEPQQTSVAAISAPEWVNFYGLRVFVDGEPAPVGSGCRPTIPGGYSPVNSSLPRPAPMA